MATPTETPIMTSRPTRGSRQFPAISRCQPIKRVGGEAADVRLDAEVGEPDQGGEEEADADRAE